MLAQIGDGLWTDRYSPAKIRWWHAVIRRHERPSDPEDYCHFSVLHEMLHGRSAEETEMLDWCYRRVVHERAGHRVTGEWCVCLSENPPSAGEARGSVGGDGMSSLIAVKQDLEHAADQLPISWTSTQGIFEAQSRADIYRVRLSYYRRNERVREIDRWIEPRDPQTGRARSSSLTFYLMALALGGAKTECAWPKSGSLVERDVFAAHLQARSHRQEAA